MKKLELTFAAILVPLDYLMLIIAGTLAYFLRFESFVTDIRPVIFEMSYTSFLQIAAVAALVWLAVFAINGLYSTKRQNFVTTFFRILVSCSAATLIIVVAFFFNFQLFSSRLIILTGWLLSIMIITLERGIVYFIKKSFYRRGIGVRRVVVIGQDKNARDIISEFANHPSFGFKVIAEFSHFDQPAKEQLKLMITDQPIDDVILAESTLPDSQKEELINFCSAFQLNYKYAASLLETKLINFELSTVAGVPLIEVKQTRLDGWGRIIKRTFDIILASLIFILLLPFLLIIGLLVIFTSRGPMIVGLERIGAYGKKFTLYKFRSMVKDAHKLKQGLSDHNERADGPLFKMERDPRITPFGRFIRRWSLDELPQLVNVILGKMSLVGPRPHEPQEVANYQSADRKLLAIKPGITGMAQVSGRSDLLWGEEVRLDTYYVENWSLGLDMQILLKTPKAVFSKRGAS